jgi:hypothetical protein
MLLCLGVFPIDPRLVNGDDGGHEGWIICGMLTEILAHCDTMFLLLRGQQSGDCLQSPNDTPTISAMSLFVL